MQLASVNTNNKINFDKYRPHFSAFSYNSQPPLAGLANS